MYGKRGPLPLVWLTPEGNTMSGSLRRFVVLGVAALVVAGLLTTASQAYPPRYAYRGGAVVLPNSAGLINPNYQIYPGLSVRQYAYNTAVLGRAYSQVPPWVYGYNPYPSVVNYGPAYPYSNPYAYGTYYNPYAGIYASPYGGYVYP
jgi:hypothetical protein